MEGIAKSLLIILLTALCTYLCTLLFFNSASIVKKLPEVCEGCYFLGQRDALNGNIKIDTTTFQWIESPFDDVELEDVKFHYGVSSLGKAMMEKDYRDKIENTETQK